MRLLVVNIGSSSLKLSVLDGDDVVATEELALRSGRLEESAVETVVSAHRPYDAVAHRIVHGGAELTTAVVVDGEVRRRLDALVDLAPLHLPGSLAGLDLVGRLVPGVPVVACFDTAFHAHLPPAAGGPGRGR